MHSIPRGSMLRSLKLGGALLVVIAFSLATASPAAAATAKYGPFASTSPDSGTCGNDWANDTFRRVFTVNTTPTASGTYRVRQDFNHGSFVTVVGHSPGACESGTDNLKMVATGVTGRMGGSFTMIVSGTYSSTAVCTVATCGTTAGFISTVFGSTATYDVPTFSFRYVTHCNGVWINASADRGGNRGDITGMAHDHVSGAHHPCGHDGDGGHHGDDDNDENEDNDD